MRARGLPILAGLLLSFVAVVLASIAFLYNRPLVRVSLKPYAEKREAKLIGY